MDFTVSIVTAPDTDLDVRNDIELIKLGLLYSDKIVVSSPSIYHLNALAKISTSKGKDKFIYFNELSNLISSYSVEDISKDAMEVMHIYEKVKFKSNKTYEEVKNIMFLESRIKDIFAQYDEIYNKIAYDSGFISIQPFIQDGKISINNLGTNNIDIAQIILDGALESLGNELVYPIFDTEISNLVSAYMNEYKTTISSINSKEVVVGKDLFLRLPNINKVSINEVIELRNELELEWYRYRSLVNEYSEEIEDSPFSSDINLKLAKKYENDFKPQLLELQKDLDNNSFIKNMYNSIADNVKSYSVLCIGAASFVEIKNAMIGASGAVVAHGIKALNDKRKGDEKIKENKLYFYHRLSKLK